MLLRMESTELKENETERKVSTGEDSQSTMSLRYIVVNSRMYQIFEDAPSVKVCSA